MCTWTFIRRHLCVYPRRLPFTGDRITGITVSLSHVVLEDALTILSYASPYDVQIHLEKDRRPAPGAKQAVASQPSTSGERLCHPFYRSQSIDDLTKVGGGAGLWGGGIGGSRRDALAMVFDLIGLV